MTTSLNKLIFRLLKKFNNKDIKKSLFERFSQSIIMELKERKVALSYAEKILRHTYSYLVYCNYFKLKNPTQFSLEGYIWLHYQQKYFLTKIVEFLHKYYNIQLNLSKINKPKLTRPKRSHQILKERVIYILNNPEDRHLTQKYIFDAFIGYFHWIYIPKNVFVSLKNIKKTKYGAYYIKINSFELFLPDEIVDYFNTSLVKY